MHVVQKQSNQVPIIHFFSVYFLAVGFIAEKPMQEGLEH